MAFEKEFASETEAARILGRDRSWLAENLDRLENQFGFPKIDPAIGKRHVPSIKEWARERNSTTRRTGGKGLNPHNQENFDAL